MIRSRVTRYTYGTSTLLPFREGVDPVGRRTLDSDGNPYCEDRFRVFVSNGDSIEVEHVVERQTMPLRVDQENIFIGLYRALPPHPDYVDEPQCESIGSLTIDLSKVMHLPREQRLVRVMFKFGTTEIEVDAINVHTQQHVGCSLRFDASY